MEPFAQVDAYAAAVDDQEARFDEILDGAGGDEPCTTSEFTRSTRARLMRWVIETERTILAEIYVLLCEPTPTNTKNADVLYTAMYDSQMWNYAVNKKTCSLHNRAEVERILGHAL